MNSLSDQIIADVRSIRVIGFERTFEKSLQVPSSKSGSLAYLSGAISVYVCAIFTARTYSQVIEVFNLIVFTLSLGPTRHHLSPSNRRFPSPRVTVNQHLTQVCVLSN